MKKHFKKLTACLLVVLMLSSFMPMILLEGSNAIIAQAETADTNDYAVIESINEAINALVTTEEFKNLSIVEKQVKLHELEIEKCGASPKTNSFVADVDADFYAFVYPNGMKNIISLKPIDPYTNAILGDVDTAVDAAVDTAVESAETAYADTEANALSNDLDALILFAFNGVGDDLSFRLPFYYSTESSWESKGLNTYLDTSVTVADFLNIDEDYEVVTFSGHGFVYDGVPYMNLTEQANYSNYDMYEDMIARGGIDIFTDSYYGINTYAINPSFFRYHVSSTALDGKFFFSESCSMFGEFGRVNNSFATEILNCGAEAVVGFHNSVLAIYCRDFMKQWVDSLCAGKTAQGALDDAIYKYGADDDYEEYGKGVAYPILRGNTSAKLVTSSSGERFTVTFNPNGGTVSPTSVTVEAGGDVTLPTPEKYFSLEYNPNGGRGGPGTEDISIDCLGWSESPSAYTPDYYCGETYSLAASGTIYAVWEEDAEHYLSSIIPVRSGYEFLGWSTDPYSTYARFYPGEQVWISGDVCIYAVWEYTGDGCEHYYRSETITPATCTSRGTVRYTCVECGSSYTSSVPATGHTPGEWEIVYEATRYEEGWKVRECTACGYLVDEEAIPMLPFEVIYDEDLIKTPSQTRIRYGDTLTLHVNTYKIPDGGFVEWYKSNDNFDAYYVDDTQASCIIYPEYSGTTEFQAVVYDSEGYPLYEEIITLEAKAGFFDKIFGFFRMIFGLSKDIPEFFKAI